MSREIKFRAWNVRRFLQDDEVAILPYRKVLFLVKDGESDAEYREMDFLDVRISLFTGLKDKNGKEIYEGDILDVEDEGRPFVKNWKGVVKFIDGSYLIENMEGTDGEYLFNEMREVEVIGNIYENPELLEATP